MVIDEAQTDEPGPVYAFYFATIRVEVDPGDESVTEVLVARGRWPTPP